MSPQRHTEMMFSNLGASLDGGWRNEVGRLAYVSFVTPIVKHLHQLRKIHAIIYKLKGAITAWDDDNELGGSTISETIADMSAEELDHRLAELEEQRIVYRRLDLLNGNSVLFNRQIVWSNPDTAESMRIGPDIMTETSTNDEDIGTQVPWIAELKGGADPAGSDEHWKTASRAFDRVIEAAEKTGRAQPLLSFLATILVDRVAKEVALWIEEGKLYSVYNLTKIENDPELRREFMAEVVELMEMGIERC